MTNGIVYALVGMGLSAIFKGSRVINAMQGEFAVIGAMTTVLLLTKSGWPYPAAIAGGALAGALVGAFIEVAFVRYMALKNASEDSFLLLTIGLALTLSASVLFFIGRDGHLLPPIGGEGVVLVMLDAVIQLHALWLVAIGIGATLALRAFFHRTTVGLSMMAASIDADGAATTGINVGRMRTYTFILGGLLGALGGILVTPLISVDYTLGLNLTLKGFAAAVLGGLTNPLGAAVGGCHSRAGRVARHHWHFVELQGRRGFLRADRHHDPDAERHPRPRRAARRLKMASLSLQRNLLWIAVALAVWAALPFRGAAQHRRPAGVHGHIHDRRPGHRPSARPLRHRQPGAGDLLRARRLCQRLLHGDDGLAQHHRLSGGCRHQHGAGLRDRPADPAPHRLLPRIGHPGAERDRERAVLRVGLADRRNAGHRRHSQSSTCWASCSTGRRATTSSSGSWPLPACGRPTISSTAAAA